MMEMLKENNLRTLRKKSNTKSTLVFQIPESVINRLNQIPLQEEIILELETREEKVVSLDNLDATANFNSELEIKEVEFDFRVEQIIIEKDVAEVVVEPIVESILEIKSPKREITPFYELKLQNPEAVYKIGHSYLADIEQGKKHFGFSNFKEGSGESHLLVYASFIHQALKKPVLIVVQNLEGNSFDRYRSQLTEGNLLGWKTKDWGDLCFVDYRQLTSSENKFNKTNVELINNQFAAILWAMPKGNARDKFQHIFLTMVGNLNSLTLMLEKGVTTSKEVNKTVEYYKCFNVPIKGMLFDS
jgi:hypothetical protein